MFDLKRTLSLLQGALFDPERTWAGYLPEAGDWKKTAMLLTGPLIVAASLVAYVLGLFSDASLFGMFRPTIGSTLINMVMGAIAAAVAAFIVSALAGVFGGKSSFAHGLAATTLAFVPGYLGEALVGLPWIGGLLALGLMIYGLVLLWRIIPSYLQVPSGKRVVHYIASLIAIIVAMVIIGSLMGGAAMRSAVGPSPGRVVDRGAPESSAPGIFGGMARQAELIEAAQEDRFQPPKDGKLEERQVVEFLRAAERAGELRAEQEQRLKALAEKAEEEEELSFRDFGEMMTGMSGIAGMQTVEIEVVKSAGGNWAEHQWVREALRTAWIQKDINDAVAHNYALYQEYEDRLAQHVTR